MATRVDIGGASDKCAREKQEDCFMAYYVIEEVPSSNAEFEVDDNRYVYMGVLCDGMGGMENGAWCARQAVQKYAEAFAETGSFQTEWKMRMHMSLYTANAGVAYFKERTHKVEKDSGCTLVSTVLCGDTLHYISVGDSYIWLFRKNDEGRYDRLLLNNRHSEWVKMYNDAEGQPRVDRLTEEEARKEQAEKQPGVRVRTVIPQSCALVGRELGYLDESPAGGLRLKDGDIVVLASDGVRQALDDTELNNVIYNYASPQITADQQARQIIDKVRFMGVPKQDNASCIVFKVSITD